MRVVPGRGECAYSRTDRSRVLQTSPASAMQRYAKAVWDAERGLIAADPGGGVIKQRIARPGKGKSGGFRTLIVFQAKSRAFFVYGLQRMKRRTSKRMSLPL